MPNSRGEMPLRGGVEERSQGRAVPEPEFPNPFRKILGKNYDFIMKYTKLSQSFRLCGHTFRLIGFLYAAFFTLFVLVSKLEVKSGIRFKLNSYNLSKYEYLATLGQKIDLQKFIMPSGTKSLQNFHVIVVRNA